MVKKSILWVIILSLISLSVVFFKFNQIPQHLDFDEVEFARLALSLFKTPVTIYSPYATGHATPYFYLILSSFLLFDVTSFALRLPAAIFGALCPIVLYYIGFELKKPLFQYKESSNIHINSLISPQFFAFILGLLLITQSWYFNFARFAFEATFMLFLELISVYFLVRFINKPTIQDVLGLALFAALAYNSYIPGRLFFVLPLLFIILQARRTGLWNHLLIFIITFVVFTAPLNLHLMSHGDSRVSSQSYLNNAELSITEKAQFFASNVVSSQTMLFYPGKGDNHGTHNYPYKNALNPIMYILFFGGLIIALLKFRTNTIIQLFFAYYLISIIPTLLTYPWENPNMLRMYSALVPIVFFSSLSILWVMNYTNQKIDKKYAIILAFIIISLSAAYEFRSYYMFHVQVFNQAFEMINIFIDMDPDRLKIFYLNQ